MEIEKVKLKKRLRKKFHVGEYREWGTRCEIDIEFQSADDEIAFLDKFLDEAITANGCYFGGLLKAGFIELGQASDDPEGRLEKIKAWLEGNKEVKGFKFGKIIDSWYCSDEELIEEL